MKRFRGDTGNPYIKMGGASSISTNSGRGVEKLVGKNVSIEKITPGTPEYKAAEKEIEEGRRMKKSRQDEIDVRGKRGIIGQCLAENKAYSINEIDESVKKEIQREIQEAKKSNSTDKIENHKKILENVDYDMVKERLAAVQDLLEIDYTNEFAWETNLPLFFKAFEEWLKKEIDPKKIVEVTRSFFNIMDNARQIDASEITARELKEKKDNVIKSIASLLECKKELDAESQNCLARILEEVQQQPIYQEAKKIYSLKEVMYIKNNTKKSLCIFFNIRNEVVANIEDLLKAIKRYLEGSTNI